MEALGAVDGNTDARLERRQDIDKVGALSEARGTARLTEAIIAGSTLALILVVPRISKRVPAPLAAIAIAAIGAAIAHAVAPGFDVVTIGSRFHTEIHGLDVAGIPPVAPRLGLPWGDGLSFSLLRETFAAALAIAPLGALESLLAGVVVDGMTGTKHEPNGSLQFEAIFDERAAIASSGRSSTRADRRRMPSSYVRTFEDGSRFRVESAVYWGDHFIEAFLLRNNVCVARSEPFVVRAVAGAVSSPRFVGLLTTVAARKVNSLAGFDGISPLPRIYL